MWFPVSSDSETHPSLPKLNELVNGLRRRVKVHCARVQASAVHSVFIESTGCRSFSSVIAEQLDPSGIDNIAVTRYSFMIVYNYDADLEVSDTCVRSSLLS